MNNTIRIRTNPNGTENVLKVNLQQDFDFVEILSLKLTQKDLYTKFCSDYGVIVGRVYVNGGFGVPNAKVSIFIPIDQIDKEDSQILGLYPYELISDVDANGVRYNLLEKNRETSDVCYTPVGTMLSKREVLDNDDKLDVYCKYYKFTTTTNNSGDYMIFGAPIGAQIMHVEADMSDIGIISQKPFDYIQRGSSVDTFESVSKFRKSDDLGSMNHIINRSPIGVNVEPFWGDKDMCNVSITRHDVDMNTTITPSAIFMGSIFGDNEQNSISLRCKPSEDLGNLDGQTTGPGTIEMIRETIDGSIERFDVSGGNVIDSDGTWAYQVPMNLEYRITDEYGDFVPSDNPKVGIPTKSRVRFRVGMTMNGGNGNPLTRAKYLIPHNPQGLSQGLPTNQYTNGTPGVDYEFGPNTLKSSLAEFEWNTIYTIKNYIPRYEKTKQPSRSKVRTHTGIKDVDSARGKYTPHPYNRMFFQEDAMFSFLCGLVLIIATIITTINFTIVSIINTILSILNDIIDFFGGDAIPYLPCITMGCSDGDNDYSFAPGCCGANDNSNPPVCDVSNTYGCEAAQIILGNVICTGDWPNGENSFDQTLPPGDAGLTNCIAISLIKSMNLLEFDFYNDWVNGTLYSPLFNIVTKRDGDGSENFCEWSTSDMGSLPLLPYTVDNDNDGTPDNEPYDDVYLKDTCWGRPFGCPGHDPLCGGSLDVLTIPITNPSGIRNVGSNNTREGLIVKKDGTYYYAPYSRTLGRKLFASDIVTLGSSIKCNINGLPYLPNLYSDTTYKLPPYLDEIDTNNLGQNVTVTSGMDSISSNPNLSLFFDVNCFYFYTSTKHCSNIKLQCELGVGLSRRRPSSPQAPLITLADDLINNDDIDIHAIRSVFAWMNSYDLSQTPLNINNPTAPNYLNLTYDPYISCGPTVGNGQYNLFRYGTDVAPCNDKVLNSLYFYFGLNRNKTALNKMIDKYFKPCEKEVKFNFSIVGNTTNNSGASDGSIDITIIGGVGPYTYHWQYPNGSVVDIQNGDSENDGDISMLDGGLYTLTVTDSSGLVTTSDFVVSDPIGLSCGSDSLDSTTTTSNNGIINVYASGGQEPYTISVSDAFGNPLISTQTPISISALPYQITNLPISQYAITVTDSDGAICTTSETVGGPELMAMMVNSIYIGGSTGSTQNPAQYDNVGSSDWDYTTNTGNGTTLCNINSYGTINITPVGGVAPYTFNVQSVLQNNTYQSTTQNNSQVPVGTYNITLTDAAQQVINGTYIITAPAVTTTSATIANSQGGSNGVINVFITQTTAPYTYRLYDSTQTQIAISNPIQQLTYSFNGLSAGTYYYKIRNGNNCYTDFSSPIIIQ